MKKAFDCPPDKKPMYDPITKKWYFVDAENYDAIHHDFWKFQTNQARAGLCTCPFQKRWQCTGDCVCCNYYNSNRMVSLDAPINQHDESLTGHEVYAIRDISMEELIEKQELLNALYAALDSLTEKERSVCTVLVLGRKDDECATLLGITLPQYRYRKNKVLLKLRKILSPYK